MQNIADMMMMITMIEDDGDDGEFTCKGMQNIGNMIMTMMMTIMMMIIMMVMMVSPERVCRTWPV